MPENMDARLDMLMRALFNDLIVVYNSGRTGTIGARKSPLDGRAAIVTLAIGLVIALVLSALWFVR